MGDFKITNRGTHCILTPESAGFTLAMNWFTALCNLPFGVGSFFQMVDLVLVPFMAWIFPGDDPLSWIGLTKSGDEKSFARACEVLRIPQDADKSRDPCEARIHTSGAESNQRHQCYLRGKLGQAAACVRYRQTQPQEPWTVVTHLVPRIVPFHQATLVDFWHWLVRGVGGTQSEHDCSVLALSADRGAANARGKAYW